MPLAFGQTLLLPTIDGAGGNSIDTALYIKSPIHPLAFVSRTFTLAVVPTDPVKLTLMLLVVPPLNWAPFPIIQEYVLPGVSITLYVIVLLPGHTLELPLIGLVVGWPVIVMGRLTGAPTHPLELVSTTLTFPTPVEPHLTNLLSGVIPTSTPPVIVHEYVLPVVGTTLYQTLGPKPLLLGQTMLGPLIGKLDTPMVSVTSVRVALSQLVMLFFAAA
jgi:hypothetical protein